LADPTTTILSNIYYEDPHLIVLSKPSGLLSQGEKKGDPNLVDALRDYLGRPYVGLIHRLDRNTSGIMIVAKRSKSAQRLTTALQQGEIRRTYLAWLVGELHSAQSWTHELKKNEKTNQVSVVRFGGKSASLFVHPVRYAQIQGTRLTLAEFELQTGRSHQIRVQSAFEGFPVLGDQKYGKHSSAPPHSPLLPSFNRLALHSYHIEFPHPISKEILKFESPLPEELQLK
jgi:23S rRNA pseudouridine1911/1915/1917 synthase